MKLLGPTVDPSIAVECGGHVSRCPVAFDAWYCVKTITSRCGHMTGLVFMISLLCLLGVGVRMETGALGLAVGSCGVIPCIWEVGMGSVGVCRLG